MTPIIEAKSICKRFARRVGVAGQKQFQALVDVSLQIEDDSIVGIAGESGSGKSTLARCVAMLERPDSGDIAFAGRSLCNLSRSEARRLRPRIQLIFQDVASSFNWNWSTLEVIAEPLEIHGAGNKSERLARALNLMEDVGIPTDAAMRSPLEMSGGQRQRIAIARALAAEPRVLIFDESFSGLDLRIQSEVLELLLELRAKRQLTYVVISHDLGLLRRFANQICVLHRGSLVEQGPPESLFAAPAHEHTRALVSANQNLRLAGMSRSAVQA